MKESIKLISTCLEHNIEDIKLTLLFADKIEIPAIQYIIGTKEPEEMVDGQTYELGKDIFLEDDRMSNGFKDQIQVLVDEGLVNLNNSYYQTLYQKPIGEQLRALSRDIVKESWRDIILKPYDQPQPKGKKYYLIDEEAERIAKELGNTYNDLVGFVLHYYVSTLAIFFNESWSGATTITSSEVVTKFLRYFYERTSKFNTQKTPIKNSTTYPQIAFDTLKLSIPTISALAFEDVLELKYKLNDELLRFQYEMQRFQFEMENEFDQHSLPIKAREIAKFRIQPAIEDLTTRLTSGSYSFVKTILTELKDPKSYTPLLTSVFGNVPSHLTILLSAGLISITTYMELVEHFKQRSTLRKNGLFYILDLTKRIKNKSTQVRKGSRMTLKTKD
ncbi:MAG: hypothetical protein H7Y13_16050 [Sphingobacteriaceae bacterium]|nr:hypothetical protein [Sphingobacteriaceae bacterium]